MVIVPNVCGFASFSPRLNAKGNSVRGYEFCKRLVQSYRLHIFEPLRNGNEGCKIDPRHNGLKDEQTGISHLAWAASVGDEFALRIRDMYVYGLVRTALASEEGLSERKLAIIHDQYQLVFLAHLDPALLDRIVKTTKERIEDADFIFHGEIQVSYAFKKAMLGAAIQLVVVDNRVNPEEREVVLRIADLLGLHRNAAMLEMNRNERHVGHRYQKVELPSLIEDVASSVHGGVAAVAAASRHAKGRTSTFTPELSGLALEQADYIEGDGSSSGKTQKEVFELRRHLLRLGKRLSSMSKNFRGKQQHSLPAYVE